MVTLIYRAEDGDEVSITRDIDPTYPELVNLFYSLSLGIGFSQKTVDNYIDCEYNDFAVSNDCRKNEE